MNFNKLMDFSVTGFLLAFFYFPFWKYFLHSISKKLIIKCTFLNFEKPIFRSSIEEMSFKEILEHNKTNKFHLLIIFLFIITPPFLIYTFFSVLENQTDVGFLVFIWLSIKRFCFDTFVGMVYYYWILK